MSQVKPVILLCWGYNRPGWIQFFEQLNDQFHFIYLFFMRPQDEDACFTQNSKIYYTHFRTPKQLLKKIKPHKIVFMGLDGLQPIAINIQAKKMGITTYFMMHGSASIDLEDYQNVVYVKRNILRESFSGKICSWFFTFRFLVAALGFKYLNKLPVLIKYQLQKIKVIPQIALKKNKTSFRNPDKYIVFSKKDINFFIEQDEANPDDFFVIGNLEIISFVKHQHTFGLTEKGYLLYIETPLSEIEHSEFSNSIITKDENIALIEGLNNCALKMGLKLYIKLHPYTYSTSYYPCHNNIVYFKDCNKEELILNANKVVFYHSSLSIPAMVYKNCFMIRIKKLDGFQKNVAATGVCKIIGYEEIIEGRCGLFDFETGKNERKTFIQTFIGEEPDGQNLDKLSCILKS